MLLQAQNKVLDALGPRKVVDNGAKSDLKQGTQCKISWEQPNTCSLRGKTEMQLPIQYPTTSVVLLLGRWPAFPNM